MATSRSTISATSSVPLPTNLTARVVDACVHYGDLTALAPSTFELERGTTIALVGANGSGKTTLISLLAGLIESADGRVDAAHPVALVAQHRHHHRWMPLSVDEVLRMGRYGERGLLGRLRAHDRALIDAAAEQLEVTHLRRRPFGDLSGGQQQRVLVAQALASDPALLLLDEPITGLDLPSQLRILDVIAGAADDGRTVVFSTHHLAEARRADRVMLLAGCILADGTPGDVLVPTLLAEAFGGRLIRDDGSTVVVDEHGHDHGPGEPHELGPHHEFHLHDHHHDHDHDHHRDQDHDDQQHDMSAIPQQETDR
ncbi:MAG: Mn2+/Zn2+ ABC transporter ATP-bidning protein [Acidimicrobiaceae bacterium]|nr:Mn2+/Zn2+ ABC transporter ATP-bidning protein [Acidimicrobiaceae bacterium]